MSDLAPDATTASFLASAAATLYPELNEDVAGDPQGPAALSFALVVDAVRLAVSAQLAAEPGVRPEALCAELLSSVVENLFDVSAEVAIPHDPKYGADLAVGM